MQNLGGQTECIMGNWKIENGEISSPLGVIFKDVFSSVQALQNFQVAKALIMSSYILCKNLRL